MRCCCGLGCGTSISRSNSSERINRSPELPIPGNSRIPIRTSPSGFDLSVGGSLRSGNSSEAKNYSERSLRCKSFAFKYMALRRPGIRDAFAQRKEGHHEKEFHPHRKESRVRGSIWLCAHRGFCLIGLQHGSWVRTRYRARRRKNSGRRRCCETAHVEIVASNSTPAVVIRLPRVELRISACLVESL